MKKIAYNHVLACVASLLLLYSCGTTKHTANVVKETPQVVEVVTPPAVPVTPEPPKDPDKFYSGNYELVPSGQYDNGKMWTFSYPPKQYFRETYGFDPSDEWLTSVRQSALRFATYCTASFVSADGLVMTNHHCGRESVTAVTKKGEDLPTDGFYAKTLAEERKVPDLFVDQLVMMQDVTKEVLGAMDAGKDPAEKVKLRTEAINKLVKENQAKTGLTIQVHNFYNGSIYQMYGYKRYNDVRLVMSPETQLGFFGGDPDNFTYPRYCLDYNFFRVYDENGKPLKTTDYFKWSNDGPAGKEPIFVVGNPGTTRRLITMSMLEYDRDITSPYTINMLETSSNALWDYIQKHPESKLQLMDEYFGMMNGLKAYKGFYNDGLKNAEVMGKRADFERKFISAVKAKPALFEKYGTVWGDIESTRNEMRKYVGRSLAFMPMNTQSTLFGIANSAIGIAKEMKKPAAERMKGFSDEEIKAKIAKLKTDSTYKPELEAASLYLVYSDAYKYLGSDHAILAGTGSEANVKNFTQAQLTNSIVAKPGEIQKLFDQGADAVLTSNDPILHYAKMANDSIAWVNAQMKPLRDRETQNIQKLGQAFYAVYGTGTPPDANFTLRIADGVIKGYDYNGTTAPDYTTFYGLYDRYYSFDKKDPWSLPKKWIDNAKYLKMDQKMNYVSTNDIIGGNSGSAMINKNKEVVGLIFDGNIESLPGRYIFYEESGNRTVAVHSGAILESLRAIYKADRLVKELKSGKIIK